MIGEMEFDAMFHSHVTEDSNDPFIKVYYSTSSYVLFFWFLVLMTVIIMNLLVSVKYRTDNDIF